MRLDDPGVDIGDGVVVEDDLASDDQVFPCNFTRQQGTQSRNADFGRLAGVHFSGILLINLGDGIHHVRITDLEDSLFSDTFAGPRLDAQDPAGGG